MSSSCALASSVYVHGNVYRRSRSKGEPEQAEALLAEALRSYVCEGWSFPVTHTRKQMGECQKLLGRSVEYPPLGRRRHVRGGGGGKTARAIGRKCRLELGALI